MRGSFGDAVLFVDLAPVWDPSLVISVLASTLGIAWRADEPVAAIVHFLRDERLLIVFDNCLQVIEAVAALADRVLGETGETHMLITSREPLRDAARSEDVAVADDASLFVTGADQGQTGCLTPLTRWRSGLRNLKERGYDRDDDDARQRTTLRKWLPPRFRIAHVLAGRPFLA